MRHRSRRTLAALIGSATILAACGGGSDGESAATLPQPAAESPATEPAVEPTPDTEAAPAETDAAAADEPASSVPEEAETADTAAAEPDATTAPTEPPATEAPAPAEAVLGGRTFASELTTDSEVLPDLQVDDIRRGEKINLRNVFPAERPVLFWLWAPH